MDQGGDTYQEGDKSMNKDEGYYQLSHIYGNLFAPNLSGERRLDRQFRKKGFSRGRNVNINLKKVVF